MLGRIAPCPLIRRLGHGVLTLALGGAALATPVLAATVAAPTPAGASPASAASGIVSYLPGTPSLATIANPAGCSDTNTTCAPWNTAQGTSNAPRDYSTTPAQTFVLPTYTPSGPTTTTGGTVEPNVAVYPGATTKTTGSYPYPAGVVGTPGPMDDYCGPGTNKTERVAGHVTRQPAGSTLPLSPDYFPHVVKNANGTLTGYFDYRPKTGDEALVAATATATGKHWTYAGEALEQNPGYCPTADVNDDGEGHANIVHVGNSTFLYTLPRAAGDMSGVGLVIHKVNATATHPLGSGATTLPRDEQVGVDPDAFVPQGTGAETLTHGTAQSISVTTTGNANSPEQLVAGGFVDATVDPNPTLTDVFNCTVTLGASSLTNCKTQVSGKTVAVSAGNEILQVMGYTSVTGDVAKKKLTTSSKVSIPAGTKQSTAATGKTTLSTYTIEKKPTGAKATRGFTNRLTGTTVNTDAPDRLYIDGHAAYCTQANTNPTATLTGCTTGGANPAFTAPKNSPVTGDPIVPATSYQPATGDGITQGLVAPDGIVGVLPKYPGAPAGSTIVMYTEKELNYYVAGRTPKTTSKKGTFSTTILFTPGPYFSEDMPSVVSASSPVTVHMGVSTTKSALTGKIIPVTCTGLSTTTSTTKTTGTTVPFKELTGCTYPTGGKTVQYAQSSWIAAPGANLVPYSTLKLTGEGKTTATKLDKNNEDLSVLRVAYTTTGAVFKTTGLANTGIISGKGTEHGATYNDINNPASATNPMVGGTVDLNAYAKAGTADATEMRWVGSAGSIITNEGTIELFLSGAWAADGDSDAFNQIFYSQSTTGEQWSVPRTVISTDYTFSASQRELTPSSPTYHKRLTISAYYEGRAYGPSVVADTAAGAKLTMVFAGYRTPKGMGTATAVLGTGYTGEPQWKIGKTTPALYRNILAVNLDAVVHTNTTVTATPPKAVVGQPVTLTATVTNTGGAGASATGTVTFTGEGGTLCTATLNAGTPDTASCTYTYPGVGSDSVNATYHGDATHLASTSTTAASVTVTAESTHTVLAVTPVSPVVGETAVFTATVSARPPATGTPSGTVIFTAGTTILCTSPLGGSPTTAATCTVSFPTATTDTVTATYIGNTTALPSSDSTQVDIAQDSTTTTVTASEPSALYTAEQTAQFGVTVATAHGEAVPNGETVTIHVGPASCTATLSGGSGGCSISAGSLGVGGPYTVSATYGGDANLSSSTSSNPVAFSVTAVPVQVSVSGSKTYGSSAPTFTYTDNPPVALTGTLVCGAVAPTAPISNTSGAGTYTITGASCSGLSATGYAVSYSGVVNGFVVGKDSTSTIVTESRSSASYPSEHTVTFGVVVTAGNGETVPNGETVAIHVGPAGCTVTLTSGIGTCSVPAGSLGVGGPYAVSASYGGDANLEGSTSANAVTFSVTAAPVTVDVSGSSTYGSSSPTFTYTDNPSVPLSGTLVCGDVGTGTPISATLGAGSYTVTASSCHGLSAVGYAVTYNGVAKGYVVAKDTTTTTVTESEATAPYTAEHAATFGATVTTAHGGPVPNGETITIHVGPASCTATLSGGSGNCSVPAGSLTVGGPYAVTATYGGDANLSSSTSSNPVAFSVTAVPVQVSVSGSMTYGSSHPTFTYSASPSVNLTGTLTCSEVGQGTLVVAVPPLAAGTYTLNGPSCGGLSAVGYAVSYAGAVNGFVVGKDSTTTTVSGPASASYATEGTAAFKVTVTTHNGEQGPSGEVVTVHVGSATCQATLTNGSGSCKITATLPVGGTYAITATYAGDTNLTGSSSTNEATFSVVTVTTPNCSKFSGANLKGDDLAGADLAGCSISGTALETADLVGANLKGAVIEGSNLEGANLQGADLQTVTLTGTNLEKATLPYADVQGVNLEGDNLTDANLTDDDLLGDLMQGADLQSADLAGAVLSDVNLEGANLEDANLAGANLTDAELQGANLADANLTGADLADANLEGANLADANLTGANLTGANETGANLKGSTT